jgi:hypothetical protein
VCVVGLVDVWACVLHKLVYMYTQCEGKVGKKIVGPWSIAMCHGSSSKEISAVL